MDKTQTERVCDMLDMRDISYTTMERPHGMVVVWKDRHGNEWQATDIDGGLDVLPLDDLTPEQAVEATLGRGTCHEADVGGGFVCSECEAYVRGTTIGRSYVDKFGKRWFGTSNKHKLNYCPNCGRKLVDA